MSSVNYQMKIINRPGWQAEVKPHTIILQASALGTAATDDNLSVWVSAQKLPFIEVDKKNFQIDQISDLDRKIVNIGIISTGVWFVRIIHIGIFP